MHLQTSNGLPDRIVTGALRRVPDNDSLSRGYISASAPTPRDQDLLCIGKRFTMSGNPIVALLKTRRPKGFRVDHGKERSLGNNTARNKRFLFHADQPYDNMSGFLKRSGFLHSNRARLRVIYIDRNLLVVRVQNRYSTPLGHQHLEATHNICPGSH